ncbi:hypothetical protein TIFTF001_054780 [Ficus carica]|uniref:BHLH domain-containing protein n=2 Tax=Ficus carica TaxID=3494 RepID=A0AA88EDY5_FICCA|nr:hypothetical protein TIFTF001_054780 [Ficus carica]
MALEEYDQNHKCGPTNNFADSSSFAQDPDIPSLKQQQDVAELDQSLPSTMITGDPTMIKKLSHNASERDRRKKINSLYSSLRSLLPVSNRTKKLSNLATVLRVLKYIPELEKQVTALIHKKEELFSSISRKLDVVYEERQKKSSAWRSLSAVSASRLNDREVVLQISTFNVQEIPLSHILLDLEEDGFSLLNATSYVSFGGRVFYSLHLQVQRSHLRSNNFSDNFLSSF